MPLTLTIPFLTYLFIFHTFYFIHHFLILVLIPGLGISFGVLAHALLTTVFRIGLHMSSKLNRTQVTQKTLALMLVAAVLTAGYSLQASATSEEHRPLQKATNNPTTHTQFLANNQEDIIVNFRVGVGPGGGRIIFYTKQRTVAYATTYREFVNAFKDPNAQYGFMLVKVDTPPGRALQRALDRDYKQSTISTLRNGSSKIIAYNLSAQIKRSK